jgi:hypothetical protein
VLQPNSSSAVLPIRREEKFESNPRPHQQHIVVAPIEGGTNHVGVRVKARRSVIAGQIHRNHVVAGLLQERGQLCSCLTVLPVSDPRNVEGNPGQHESCPIRVIFHEDAREAIRQVMRL